MRRWIVLALLCSAGCGSSSGTGSGPGNATGSVAGHDLVVKDAVFAINGSDQLLVLLADRTDLCGLIASTTPPTGETTALVLAMTQLGLVNGVLDAVPPTAGDYSTIAINPTTAGRYFFGGLGVGTGCDVSAPAALSGGTVSVTQMGSNGGGNTQASFTLHFGSDTLTGNFNATSCAALLNPGPGCDIGSLRTAPVR